MPYLAFIGTDLRCWESPHARVPCDDEDAITGAEVHNFFTGIELISYEDLGFAGRFGGHKLVEADVTTIGRGLPVNRGKAVNQVDRARIGLAHNIGGPTMVSAAAILEGPDHGAR